MSKKTAAPAKNETDSPSMEDILNSIRGVVEGDEDAAELEADADLPEEEDETDEEDEDILLLDTPAFEDDEEPEKTPETPDPEPAVEKEAEEDAPSADDLLESLFDDEPEETEEKTEAVEPDTEETPEDEPEEPEITSDLIADLTAKAQEDTGEQTTTRRLISDTAAEESTIALKHLMESIPKQKPASPTLRADMTLEELVVESIRPHLAMWLNENLPDIVKQLVQKEIRKLLPDED